MARFDKLEFDGGQPERSDRKQPAPARDDRHWSRLADENRRAGQYENALRFYSRALEENRAVVSAWVGQVQMLNLLGEYPQARQWSQKALELLPNHPDLLAGQAQAECRLARIREALALSDAALQQKGESAYRWQVRGEILLSNRQRTERDCFDRAQIADPNWLVPLESALIYLHYKSFANGHLRARLAVEKSPSSAYAWYVLGLAQANLHMVDAARLSFERCCELTPGHRDASDELTKLSTQGWSWSTLWSRWGRR